MSEHDNVLNRISECQTIVDKIDSSDVWAIVTRDCQRWVELIDSKWQHADEKQLGALRIQKLAYFHILQIREKYMEELKGLIKQLNTMDNLDKIVPKDYDSDSRTEGRGTTSYGTD